MDGNVEFAATASVGDLRAEPFANMPPRPWESKLLGETLAAEDQQQLLRFLLEGERPKQQLSDSPADGSHPIAESLGALPTRVRSLLDRSIQLAAGNKAYRDFLHAMQHIGKECIAVLDLAGAESVAELTRIRGQDYRGLAQRKRKLETSLATVDGKDADLIRKLVKLSEDQLGAMADRAELLDRQAIALSSAAKEIRRLMDTCARAEAFVPTDVADCRLLRDGLVDMLTTSVGRR